MIENKPKLKRTMGLWLKRPNRVLTAVLIGNNIVNTFTAALATIVSQYLFSNSALSVAVGLTTIALLIFGEITPKTFAKHNAAKVAPIAMRILLPFYLLCLPFTVIFAWMSSVLVRLSGGKVTRTGPFVTEEDIAFMIKMGGQEGVLESEEHELLANVFEFSDTLVKEVMIPRTQIVALDATVSTDELLQQVRESRHIRMPVYNESMDDVLGFFHTKDLFLAMPDLKEFELMKHLRPPAFVPELQHISELLATFKRTKTHLAVVVDEYGGTSGIVSLEDILEEIVGEIHDEHDEDLEEEIQEISEGRFHAAAKMSIDNVGEELNIEFPNEGRYETLAGFIIASIGRMPKRGARIRYRGWVFHVISVDARRVEKVERERDVLAPSEEPIELSRAEVSGPNLRIVNT